MKGDTLQMHARDRVEELPGAGLEHPFGPDWDVFKVRGKVFMLMTEITGEPIPRARRPVDPGTFGRREQ